MVAICNASATNSRGEKENLLFFSFQSVCSSYLARNISKKRQKPHTDPGSGPAH